jgi:hypothetical protein
MMATFFLDIVVVRMQFEALRRAKGRVEMNYRGASDIVSCEEGMLEGWWLLVSVSAIIDAFIDASVWWDGCKTAATLSGYQGSRQVKLRERRKSHVISE